MADADDDLVLQSQNGDTSAFEALVRNHQQMVHALTFRMTGSPADAEDLAQETFLRAYEQIGSFNARSKFSTWLCSIAVHACLNWRRDEARRFRAQSNCAREMTGRQVETGTSPAESEMVQRAQAALMKLPAKQRAAVALTIYDGLSHAEAAKILRCSETTVSWRVFAAKRKLKTLADRHRRKTMNDFDLESRLKSIPLPARTEEYWKHFPPHVRARLRPGFAGRPPPAFFPSWVRGGAMALAVLLFALALWPASQAVLQDARVLRRELAQFPDHLRVFMADEHGMHHLIADQ
ncbi:MAG: RNA polymerase sigma factor [Verrucomicrobiota bacterium]|jgi:RNA polymerase sigma-70 factor (ECF subfamily)